MLKEQLPSAAPRWRPIHWPPSENTVLLVLAVAVGLTTAIGVYIFRLGMDFFTEYYQQALAEGVLHFLGAWAIVLILAFAGLLIGWLKHRFIGEERHHGIAGIMQTAHLSGGRLRYRQMPLKTLLASFSIGAGASVGPEDPSVQIGANLGSMLGQWLRLSDERMRLLLSAGVASGIAAAFRAPIAGVFFALEVILGDLSTSSFGVVVLASVVASVMSQSLEAGGPELGIRAYEFGGVLELPLYILLGILMAPISALFIKLLYWQHDWWHHLKLPTYLKPALAGILVGLIIMVVPQVAGTGRSTMSHLLSNQINFSIQALLLITLAKMLATTVCLGGGFVGGMFAPSLFVGAAFGAAFGLTVNTIFHGTLTTNPAAYAMVGMAAAMTGVIRAPITAVLLLFELTTDYRLILPIMLVTVVTLVIVERLATDGIYHLGLARQGIRLSTGRDIDVMQGIYVGEVMTKDAEFINADMPITQLAERFDQTHTHGLLVKDNHGQLCGIVALSDLARTSEQLHDQYPNDVSAQQQAWAALRVEDICTTSLITVTPDDTLAYAMRLISPRDLGRLPVVDSVDKTQAVGVLRRRDIIRAYQSALQRKLEGRVHANQVRLATLGDTHVIELRVAGQSPVANQLIHQVTWPQGVLVASIRRHGQTVIPHGGTQILAGDLLTMVTTVEHEDVLRKMVQPSA